MLAATKGQETAPLAAEDDSDTATKAVALDLAFTGKARSSMQRRTARPKRID